VNGISQIFLRLIEGSFHFAAPFSGSNFHFPTLFSCKFHILLVWLKEQEGEKQIKLLFILLFYCQEIQTKETRKQKREIKEKENKTKQNREKGKEHKGRITEKEIVL
jgi:hypothetical protein